jgi:hypothetical protein
MFLRKSLLQYCFMLFGLAVWISISLMVPLFGHRTNQALAAPAPFLYRPYYGSATVLSRSVSLFDHDDPTYRQDKKFVRYDGQIFTGDSVLNCQPYQTCYDGHNGYDLNMSFEPVLAAGAGQVIRAGWFNAANHSDGGGLWVAIDHGNGYATMYCHLSSILVTVGQTVTAQMQIGTTGTTGSSTGPHLHFTLFQMPGWVPTDPFGWKGTFSDPNPVADNYVWVANPQSATQSPNLGADHGALHTNAIVVDNDSTGFSTIGSWQRATGSGTFGSSMLWTWTTTESATATATWQANLNNGTYEIGVYIDPINASSQWVPFTITSQNGTRTVWLDQQHIGVFDGPFGRVNTGPQWVSLGTYNFVSGQSGRVTVSNATGEKGAQLGVDAIEFVSTNASLPSSGPTATPTSTPTPTRTSLPTTLPVHKRGG